jgi:predicted DNA binding CopG/RHH family protein
MSGTKEKTKQTSKSTVSLSKKPSELFPPESLQQKKEGIWNSYDFENMPEMNKAQLDSFKPVSKEQHLDFKKTIAQGRTAGRPAKASEEKEQIRSIRISDQLLNKIKASALKAGLPWQSYVKKILIKELGQTEPNL